MERETVSLNRIEERHSLEVQPHLGSVGAVHPPAPRTHVSTLTKHPAYLLDIAYLQIETEKTIENEIHSWSVSIPSECRTKTWRIASVA